MSTTTTITDIKLPKTTLGFYIRKKRKELNLSINAFSKKLYETCYDMYPGDKISKTQFCVSFLSDIEHCRRFPSDNALPVIAKALGISEEELNEHDSRMPIEDMKMLHIFNTQFGMAFKYIVRYINEHDISPQELVRRVITCPESKEEAEKDETK